MKLTAKNLALLVTPKLASLVPKAKPIAREETRFSPNATFNTYSKHSNSGTMALEKSLEDIDMALLLKLERSIAGESISYRGFISSQLQRGPIDSAMKQALKRAVAIKRLVKLLNLTLADKKAIEMRRIAYSKG